MSATEEVGLILVTPQLQGNLTYLEWNSGELQPQGGTAAKPCSVQSHNTLGFQLLMFPFSDAC